MQTTVTQHSRPLFGRLARRGEPLEHALARLERRADFARVIGSDEGQRLLEAIRAAERKGRRR